MKETIATLADMICPVVEAYKTNKLSKKQVNKILEELAGKLDRLSLETITGCFDAVNGLSDKAYYWLKQSSLKTAPELWRGF